MEHFRLAYTGCTPILHANCIERTDGYSLASHSHTFWQAILVIEGELTITIDNDDLVLGAGYCHILPPGFYHKLKSRGYRQIGINFSSDFPALCHVYKAFPQPVTFTAQECLSYAHRLIELDYDTPLAQDMISTLCILILQTAANTMHTANKYPYKSRILEYVDANLGKSWSVGHIAAALCISSSHLERLSQIYFGMGIAALHNRKRYERACTLLIESSETISNIGESLGFSEPSNFSAFFKRYAGISPAEYRRKFI